jgi:hypothetical protein
MIALPRLIISPSNIPLLLLGLILTLIIAQAFRTYWPLRHIPGPIPGTITNLQRVWWVKTKRAHLIHQDLHKKYGTLVRTGPNMVMFDNPEAIPIVYTTRPGFIKV